MLFCCADCGCEFWVQVTPVMNITKESLEKAGFGGIKNDQNRKR